MRGAGGDRNRIRSVLDIGSRDVRRTEGAGGLGHAHDGLTLLPVGGDGQQVRAARFVVEQDGFDDRFHVATHTGAVVVEFLDHAIEVIA